MPSRSRHALIASLAVVFLALPAAAFWLRVTEHFLATFDLTGSPGGSPPLAADSGEISVSGPGFTVVPAAGGGGALLVEGMGLPIVVSLTAEFESVFKGTGELITNWTVTPGQSNASCSLFAIEENDGEIIDVTWDGGGMLDVNGQPLAAYHEGVTYDCKLVLKDATVGQDTWTLTVDSPDGGTVTLSGALQLTKPLAVKAFRIELPAGSKGSFVFDEIQSISNSSTYK